MYSLLFALTLLLLVAPPVVMTIKREIKFRRKFQRLMKAHRDGYQRFLVEHAKV